MRRERYKTERNMKNQGNMTLLKEHNNFSIINSKEIKSYIIPDKEFKIIVLRKFSKLQKNSDNLAKEEYINKMSLKKDRSH